MARQETRTLDCGTPLLVEHIDGVRSAALTWLIPAGIATEPEDRQGMGAVMPGDILCEVRAIETRGRGPDADRSPRRGTFCRARNIFFQNQDQPCSAMPHRDHPAARRRRSNCASTPIRSNPACYCVSIARVPEGRPDGAVHAGCASPAFALADQSIRAGNRVRTFHAHA